MSHTVNWGKASRIVQLFTINNGDGVDKSSSGCLEVSYSDEQMYSDDVLNADGKVTVQIFGYDLPGASRHHYIYGDNEQHAFDETIKFLKTCQVKILDNLSDNISSYEELDCEPEKVPASLIASIEKISRLNIDSYFKV